MSEISEQVSTSRQVDTIGERDACGRRRWPEALKRQMVLEALSPGASVSVVARRYDVNTNQLFRWCRLYRERSDRARDACGLVPVAVAAGPEVDAGIGSIEIAFGSGVQVRVSGAVEPATLREVLTVLSRR